MYFTHFQQKIHEKNSKCNETHEIRVFSENRYDVLHIVYAADSGMHLTEVWKIGREGELGCTLSLNARGSEIVR